MATSKSYFGSNWEDVKSKIKETNIDITDDDLQFEEGKEDDFLERLAVKMNRSKEDVKAYVESIASTNRVAG